jgi:hypothetical protein
MRSKLQQILGHLSKEDLQTFKNSINSPLLGGTHKHYSFLDTFYKAKGIIAMTPYNRVLMSELYKMCEKFIIIQATLSDKVYSTVTLSRFFREVEDEKLFSALYSATGNTTPKTADDHAFMSQIEYEQWQFSQLKSRFSKMNFDRMVYHDDVSIISHKLKLMVNLLSQTHLTSTIINTSLTKTFMNLVESNGYTEVPCISMYYFAIKMMDEPENESWFSKLQKGLSEFSDYFTHDELKILLGQAINYCIRQHNSGVRIYTEYLFDLYHKALDKDYLLTHGYLSRTTYRNINTIAIRLGMYTEAKNISKTYKSKLRPEQRESAYSFNMANIYFAEGDHDSSLAELINVELDDHLSNLFAKALQLKIYYETNNFRLLDAHLDAMQVYLTRKKIIGYHKTNYSNILKYTRKLMNLPTNDREARQKLGIKIQNEKILTDKEWLLKQCGV